MKYVAKGSRHADDAPEFDSLAAAVDHFVKLGWRVVSRAPDYAKLELWLDHSNDPLAALDSDVPDEIISIGPDTAAFHWPY